MLLCSLYILVDEKEGSKKIIIIAVVVGFVVVSISAGVSWKWIATRRGKICEVCSIDYVVS